MFIDGLVASLLQNGRAMDGQTCEFVDWIMLELSLSLRNTASELTLKTKWLHCVPWRITECDNPEQADICANMLVEASDANTSPLIACQKEELAPSLQARAAGDPVSALLRGEIDRLNNTPLDEGPGEGYHRQTHTSLRRACASSAQWILADTRHNHALDLARKFIKDNGKEGEQVYRYEWQNFKRLLRPSLDKEMTTLRMTDKEFFNKVYLLDPYTQDDWSSFFGEKPRKYEPPSAYSAMRIEYLKHVLKPNVSTQLTLTVLRLVTTARHETIRWLCISILFL